MKKNFSISTFIGALCFVAMFLPAHKFISTDHSAATAQQQEGIFIFMLCKPVAQYDYQGSVKVGMRITADPLATLIKECKKNYPAADGIIINETDLQKTKADCIKFKE